MADGAFFAAVAEAADCGILLDLANLWVNERNGRQRVESVVASLPRDRVWEVHLAGSEHARGYWLDAHCGGLDPRLAAMTAEIIPELPNLGALIFEISAGRYPAFGAAAFLREMETLQDLWAGARPACALMTGRDPHIAHRTGVSPHAWERRIAARMLPSIAEVDADPAAADECGFALYAALADEFRYGAIAELLRNSVRLMVMALGERGAREVLAGYVAVTPPSAYPTDEALAFARHARAAALPIPALDDLLAFESAAVAAAADGLVVTVTVPQNIDALLAGVAAGRQPDGGADVTRRRVEVGVVPAPWVRFAD